VARVVRAHQLASSSLHYRIFRPMTVLERIGGVFLAVVVICQAASQGHKAKSLRFEAPPLEPNVVKPLRFEQQLLVCNAYPGSSPVFVKQNHAENKAAHHGIGFQECRPIVGRVQSKDKLDFVVADSGIQGTFEIGELPDTDAMLLLVVEKRDDKTTLMSFQSFAFPSHTDGKTAQLAVIDTYRGSSKGQHLRMEDHVDSKERKTISRRVEQLNFNRIYAIEEGDYDASISDHVLDQEELGAQTSKRTFHLAKKQNYVILRTGGGQFHQSLVVYPEIKKSSAAKLSTGFVAVLLSLVFAHML